jgi:hypothetical protein
MDISNVPRIRIERVHDECELIKSVQLYIQGQPFLALGKSFHGVVLDRILEDMGIEFNKIELADGTYHAERQGELYIATGMGGCFKYNNEISIRNEPSLGYGIGPDPEHLEKIKPYLSDFKLKIE